MDFVFISRLYRNVFLITWAIDGLSDTLLLYQQNEDKDFPSR